MVQTFIQALLNAIFQQVNAQLHIVGIVRTFFDTENFRLLLWLAPSKGLSLNDCQETGSLPYASH